VLRVWLFLGALLALAVYWTVGALSLRARKLLLRIVLVVAITVVLVLLVRSGQPWIAAAGAFIFTALRWVGPLLLRLLPYFLPSLRRKRTAENSEPHAGAEAPPSAQMTRAEALEILGLVEGASDEDVREAYSALIKKVHPDQGGTAYLATRVNLARDLLLPKQAR
jgi:hypothetical protein